MTCYYCGGETKTGITRLVEDRPGDLFIIDDVPADICSECGEAFFPAEVLYRVDALIKAKSEPDAEVAVPVYSLSRVAAA